MFLNLNVDFPDVLESLKLIKQSVRNVLVLEKQFFVT